MPVIELNDPTSVIANDGNPRLADVKKQVTVKSINNWSLTLYFLDLLDEEVLACFKAGNGTEMFLLLHRRTDFPFLTKKELISDGKDFLFGENNEGFYKDISIDEVMFLKETVGDMASRCTMGSNDSLVFSGAIYRTEKEDISRGDYLFVFEIGSPTSDQGGLVYLTQGREIQPHQFNIL